jgi:hypothetical protein
MNHVMIDLETLGSTPGCAILSLGAVRFHPDKNALSAEMYTRVNLQSCLAHGLKVEGDTFYWWLDQSEQARKELKNGHLYNIQDVLIQLKNFLTPEDHIWAHGTSFDLAVLAAAYGAVGFSKPWNFRQERDTRTLLAQAGMTMTKTVDAHQALFDARQQALVIMQAMKKVGWDA